MAREGRVEFAACSSFARVVADRLEHAVTHSFVTVVDHDERLLEQRLDQVEHVVGDQRIGARETASAAGMSKPPAKALSRARVVCSASVRSS